MNKTARRARGREIKVLREAIEGLSRPYGFRPRKGGYRLAPCDGGEDSARARLAEMEAYHAR